MIVTVTVERIVGWKHVLNSARTTMGKDEVDNEPSDLFKRRLLVSEHSPIRKLLYEITWENIPYWVAMHLRTHVIGFKSAEDDLYFVQTQRSDRTQQERDKLPQNAPVRLRAQINAQSMINVSRVRLCRLASSETRLAWNLMLTEVKRIDPYLYDACVPNCVYRGICPEYQSCGFSKTDRYEISLEQYRNFISAISSDFSLPKAKDTQE